MRRLRLMPVILVGSFSLLLPGPLRPASAADTQEFQAGFTPPGLVLPGDRPTVDVFVDTPTFDVPHPKGNAYVRGDPSAAFTRVPLVWSEDSGTLTGRVPTSVLAGRILDEYVVVRDPASGRSLTVPPAGAAGPYRSWTLGASPTVSVGKHRFGHIRPPDAIVARAKAGTGPGEVGFHCPYQATCAAPETFDVGPGGTVWAIDSQSDRLLEWDPGHPQRPSRTIPLSFGPSDIAIGPDGSIYVSGVKPPDQNLHIRLYAFAPDGRQLWMGRLLTEIFNAHIRIGPDGVVYGEDPESGWAPATDRHGRPLDVIKQGQRAQPYQPVSGGRELIVESTCSRGCHRRPTEALMGLAGTSGSLQRAWRIVSANTPDEFDVEFQDTTPALVGQDPVVIFAVYDFGKHLMEHLVLRLSPTGVIVDRFSLGRGAWGSEVVTGVRIGPDGALYQMQTNPKWGLKIARYQLKGAPTSSPTPPTPSTPPPTTGAPTPTVVPSLAGPTPKTPAGGRVSTAWLALSLGGVVLVGALAAAVWWRRGASSPDEESPAG